ncbi:hypothetical protein BU23DRAFT_651899 [Bimuria novae-zelandiae CBS 107.79]|uniref:Uncharacterized protein n=1 Tax=Bimuria novae-zelandiae CBS 107.79 TaxID=1447943 RepID=A0A6A5UYJ1_9PLEO|nr:hypothetical protein BU23DRAFT_651899 [Bimuria novae-zelandiae CBS 107.79]
MSPGINRGRRPIPLRLISAHGNNNDQDDALQHRAPEAYKLTAEPIITPAGTPSPRSTTFTRPLRPVSSTRSRSSLTAWTTTTTAATIITLAGTPSLRSTIFTRSVLPTRSTSPLTASSTTTTAARSSSPTRTAFVTVVSTLRSPDEERETSPPVTKTIFFSAAPQTVFVTPSSVPVETGLSGDPQADSNRSRPGNPLMLNETAKIFLIVLGSIAGVALLLSLTIVIWKKKQKTKSEVRVLESITEAPDRMNPFLDPPSGNTDYR